MPPATFTVHAPEAGYHVSRDPVAPLARVEIDDLPDEHRKAGIEMRVMNSLWPLWDRVTRSTLEFSSIRLRNTSAARGGSR